MIRTWYPDLGSASVQAGFQPRLPLNAWRARLTQEYRCTNPTLLIRRCKLQILGPAGACPAPTRRGWVLECPVSAQGGAVDACPLDACCGDLEPASEVLAVGQVGT